MGFKVVLGKTILNEVRLLTIVKCHVCIEIDLKDKVLVVKQDSIIKTRILQEILSFATKKSMIKCLKWLVIDYNNRILLQILHVKNCSHILVVHLSSRRCWSMRKDDVFFHYKFLSIWHSWFMKNWHGCPKYHMKMWLG